MSGASPSLRNAALLLHAMPADDRGWLLAQLLPGERQGLEALLAELQALGMPADRSLLAALSDDPARPPANELQSATSGGQMRLALSSPDPRTMACIAAIVSSEPPALIAMLLDIADWPWHAAVLARLDGVRRRKVDEFLKQGRVLAPRLHEPVLGMLLDRLRERGGDLDPDSGAGLPRQDGWCRRLLQNWRRVWRRPVTGKVPHESR